MSERKEGGRDGDVDGNSGACYVEFWCRHFDCGVSIQGFIIV